jgi:lipoprotein-releasing system permease protein
MRGARPALGRWARVLPLKWLLALRFLREGRVQSSLVLAGVTAGVAVTVFLTQLIAQLQNTIVERVMGSQAHVVMAPLQEQLLRLPPDQADQANEAVAAQLQPRLQRQRAVDQWERMADLAAATPGVLAVSPVASGPALATRGAAFQSVTLLGVRPQDYRRVVRMDAYMTAGRFEITGQQALIGRELADDLGLQVGDKLRVSTGVRSEVLTVAGLFDTGSREINRRRVFITLRLAQTLLDLPGSVSVIDLSVADLFGADAVADRLRAQTGLRVDSWMQTNAGLLNALSNQTISNNLIRGFVVAIVALGISSVLVVSVVQKQREIGILRAMGASRRDIMGVFLLQGALMGLLGSALGAGLAYGLLVLFSHIFKSPDGSAMYSAELDLALVLSASALACVIGLLSAYMPARRAARMDPVQAIRA